MNFKMGNLFSLWLLVLTLFEPIYFAVSTRDSMRAAIPDHLLECYRNQRLLIKDNLLPMTMPVLIDLIRKVETYQGINMDMRTLATMLLQRFRLDGIERDPEVFGNDYVIPYRPSGSEFYKYRFIMDTLIPNQQYTFPNESLTMVEQCTLHWMLSSSVDRWVRGDEGSVCNRLSKYASWNSRIKREKPNMERPHDPDAEVLDRSGVQNDMARNPNQGYQSYQPFQRGGNMASDFSLSTCPIENGVVYTNYGAVKVGVVLAGIAAGLQPQRVSQSNLVQAIRQQGRMVQSPKTGYGDYNPRGSTDYSVRNTWAATLSGEVAEVALLQGPAYRGAMRVGLGGGWNNTLVPRYYFLSEESKDALTEAEIRGGLDGLIIANNVIEWNRLVSGSLKLSQLLDMYYSESGVFDKKNRACMRKDRFNELASANILQQEVENFASVLIFEQPSAVNILPNGIQELSNMAVNKLVGAVSSMLDPSCSSSGQTGPTASPAADLYLIIDSAWDFINIQGVLSSLIEKCDVNPFGSQVTILNGKDGSVIVNTTQHSGDFYQNFTFDSYNKYQRGFDLSQTLMELQVRFEIESNKIKQSISGSYQYNKYYDNSYEGYSPNNYARQSNAYGTAASENSPQLPKIIIFIPSNMAGSGDGDSYYARNKISYFRTYLPVVKILFFVPGSKDRYSQYVDNPNDILVLTVSSSSSDSSLSISPLVTRITEVPRPITNPTCGSSWVGRWYNSMKTTAYLQPNGIHFYKLHPNYFYKSTDARIKVQSQGSSPLSVCQSRSNPLPSGNRTVGGDVYCKQITSDSFELRISDDSCGDSYAYQCQPYYISVSVSQTQDSNNVMCRDDECRYSNMIKYVISHEGLTCYSGVAKIISNKSLIIVLSALLLKGYFGNLF